MHLTGAFRKTDGEAPSKLDSPARHVGGDRTVSVADVNNTVELARREFSFQHAAQAYGGNHDFLY